LNVPQDRSCHEKRKTTRVYVIIRDGTASVKLGGDGSFIKRTD